MLIAVETGIENIVSSPKMSRWHSSYFESFLTILQCEGSSKLNSLKNSIVPAIIILHSPCLYSMSQHRYYNMYHLKDFNYIQRRENICYLHGFAQQILHKLCRITQRWWYYKEKKIKIIYRSNLELSILTASRWMIRFECTVNPNNAQLIQRAIQ